MSRQLVDVPSMDCPICGRPRAGALLTCSGICSQIWIDQIVEGAAQWRRARAAERERVAVARVGGLSNEAIEARRAEIIRRAR